jgi:hypothetical protein
MAMQITWHTNIGKVVAIEKCSRRQWQIQLYYQGNQFVVPYLIIHENDLNAHNIIKYVFSKSEFREQLKIFFGKDYAYVLSVLNTRGIY